MVLIILAMILTLFLWMIGLFSIFFPAAYLILGLLYFLVILFKNRNYILIEVNPNTIIRKKQTLFSKKIKSWECTNVSGLKIVENNCPPPMPQLYSLRMVTNDGNQVDLMEYQDFDNLTIIYSNLQAILTIRYDYKYSPKEILTNELSDNTLGKSELNELIFEPSFIRERLSTLQPSEGLIVRTFQYEDNIQIRINRANARYWKLLLGISVIFCAIIVITPGLLAAFLPFLGKVVIMAISLVPVFITCFLWETIKKLRRIPVVLQFNGKDLFIYTENTSYAIPPLEITGISVRSTNNKIFHWGIGIPKRKWLKFDYQYFIEFSRFDGFKMAIKTSLDKPDSEYLAFLIKSCFLNIAE